MKIHLRFVMRWFAAAAIIAAVLWAVDIGAAIASLGAARFELIVAALMLVQGQIVLSALRWRFTAGRLGHKLTLGRAIGEYYLASLLNLVLPGGIGGDAVRAARAAGTSEPRGGQTTRPAIVRAVVLERLAGQSMFLAIALAGVAAWPAVLAGSLPQGAFWLAAAPPMVLAIAGLAVWLLARHGPMLLRAWLRPLGPDMVRAWFARRAWLIQGGLGIVIASLYIATFALASAAVGAVLPWQAWVTAIPLVLLTMLVPVSIGGFGLREGAAAVLWPLFALAPAEGFAAAVLYGLVSIAGALPGLLVAVSLAPAQSNTRA